MLQNATPLRKSADLLTSLMNMSFVLCLPRKMHLCRSSSNVPRLPPLLKLLQNPHVLLAFDRVHNPLCLPRETTSERPKVVRTCGVFDILTWKSASRHDGVHFFNISTSTTPCAFSTSQLLKVVRDRQFFTLLTSKCVWCHNSVQLFISHLPDGSAPAALASLLFDPPEPKIIGKHSESRHFYLFAHLHLLSSDSFSSLIFFLLLFSSLTLRTSAVPSVHIVGSLTSKLPSMIMIHMHNICIIIKVCQGIIFLSLFL